MNPWLAEMYGTAEAIGADEGTDDINKLAEARVLDQMCEAEGINVDELPEETVVKLAHQIFGDNSALVKMAMEGEKEEEAEEEGEEPKEEKKEEETEEEKVAEADMLGRIMAHSFYQEANEIEKQAKIRIFPAALGKGTAKSKGVAGKIADKLKSMKGSYSAGKLDPGKTYKAGRSGGEITEMAGMKGGLKRLAKEHPKSLLAAGGAAATAGGTAGGYAAGKKKKSSAAIEALAEQRAMELLKEAGVEFEVSEEEKLAQAVEERAYAMLSEAGYLE